jgi:putative transposase
MLVMLWLIHRALSMQTASVSSLNRDDMERRRLEGARELSDGLSQSQVARKFGVSRTTASRWNRALTSSGVDALRKRKATGRPTRLNNQQLAELVEIFDAGPDANGLSDARWTTRLFARAIEARFGVRYDPDHVGRLMHKLGLRKREMAARHHTRYAASLYSPNTALSRSEISPTVA